MFCAEHSKMAVKSPLFTAAVVFGCICNCFSPKIQGNRTADTAVLRQNTAVSGQLYATAFPQKIQGNTTADTAVLEQNTAVLKQNTAVLGQNTAVLGQNSFKNKFHTS